jgi:hypothetical protein
MVDYTASITGGAGCGLQDYPLSNLTSGFHTFATVSFSTSCAQWFYYFAYYIDGTLEDAVCSDWYEGNQIAEWGERLGSTNQMGAIGFWWIKDCTGLSCAPNTDPGTPPWPARLHCGGQSCSSGYNGHIGWAGVPQSDQSWPDFNVCDNSLSSSQC